MTDGETPAGGAPPAAEPMQLIFRDSNNTEITLKLKPTTRFTKAFDAFAKKTERKVTELRFLYEGERLNAEQTIEELGGYKYSAAVNDEVDFERLSPSVHEAVNPDASAAVHHHISTTERCIGEIRICITDLQAKLDTLAANDHELPAAGDVKTALSSGHDSPTSANTQQQDDLADVLSCTPTCILFISNIDIQVSYPTFENWLSHFGHFDQDHGVRVERHPETGASKGYAVIYVCDVSEAIRLRDEMQDMLMRSQRVAVCYAMTREEALTARVQALGIEEDIRQLPSLAEQAETQLHQQRNGGYNKICVTTNSAQAPSTDRVEEPGRIWFKVRPTTNLRKLFVSFEKHVGHLGEPMRFSTGDLVLKGCASAEHYCLEDGDEIFAEHAQRDADWWTRRDDCETLS
nr:hypothetical protein B0A51_18036 [Rachicladosporium sp. CCFEE 5018]